MDRRPAALCIHALVFTVLVYVVDPPGVDMPPHIMDCRTQAIKYAEHHGISAPGMVRFGKRFFSSMDLFQGTCSKKSYADGTPKSRCFVGTTARHLTCVGDIDLEH
jgi:hypothetical protein